MIICKGCNRETRIVTVDFGIGSYEYWGAPGYDSRPAQVTACCETDWEDTDAPEPPEDYEPNVYNPRNEISDRWYPR